MTERIMYIERTPTPTPKLFGRRETRLSSTAPASAFRSSSSPPSASPLMTQTMRDTLSTRAMFDEPFRPLSRAAHSVVSPQRRPRRDVLADDRPPLMLLTERPLTSTYFDSRAVKYSEAASRRLHPRTVPPEIKAKMVATTQGAVRRYRRSRATDFTSSLDSFSSSLMSTLSVKPKARPSRGEKRQAERANFRTHTSRAAFEPRAVGLTPATSSGPTPNPEPGPEPELEPPSPVSPPSPTSRRPVEVPSSPTGSMQLPPEMEDSFGGLEPTGPASPAGSTGSGVDDHDDGDNYDHHDHDDDVEGEVDGPPSQLMTFSQADAAHQLAHPSAGSLPSSGSALLTESEVQIAAMMRTRDAMPGTPGAASRAGRLRGMKLAMVTGGDVRPAARPPRVLAPAPTPTVDPGLQRRKRLEFNRMERQRRIQRSRAESAAMAQKVIDAERERDAKDKARYEAVQRQLKAQSMVAQAINKTVQQTKDARDKEWRDSMQAQRKEAAQFQQSLIHAKASRISHIKHEHLEGMQYVAAGKDRLHSTVRSRVEEDKKRKAVIKEAYERAKAAHFEANYAGVPPSPFSAEANSEDMFPSQAALHPRTASSYMVPTRLPATRGRGVRTNNLSPSNSIGGWGDSTGGHFGRYSSDGSLNSLAPGTSATSLPRSFG